VFRGSSHLTLDSKGRLVVPARHRDVLLERCGGHMVITAAPAPDMCLMLYPLPEWEVIQQKIDALNNMDKRVRDLQRRLTGQAVDTEMDAAGRVLVSPELREYAQLEKEVVLVGQGKKFELWNREAWKALAQAPDALSPESLPPQLVDFSL
jgi:MraZ protein